MPTPEEIEKAKAVAAAVEAQFKMKDHHNHLRNARMVLLILVAAEILIGLFRGFEYGQTLDMYVEFGFAAVFLITWVTSRYFPTASLLVALLVYLLPQLLFLIFLPLLFFSGLVWKVLIISALVAGTYSSTKIPRKKSGSDAEILDDQQTGEEVI